MVVGEDSQSGLVRDHVQAAAVGIQEAIAGENLDGRTVGDHLPVEYHDQGKFLISQIKVVRGHQHGYPLCFEIVQYFQQDLLAG